MSECQHQWEMTGIQFGFVTFEKCFHCNGLRTYFTLEDNPILGGKYRDGNCFWSQVENAQSFRFNLKCRKCGHLEKFDELMGLLHCTGCLTNCTVELLQRKLAPQHTWLAVAFGFIDKEGIRPFPSEKLDILTDYFNQRRDTSRSTIKIVPADLISDPARCKGDFIYDIGMLSLEPPAERQPLL